MSVRLIRPEDRAADDQPTAGMTREQAIAADGLWAGLVRTEPSMASGWHHHGEHETAIHVLEGSLVMEFGPEGRERLEARAGDFVHVPAGVVHRESNPNDTEGRAVVVRSGTGPVTVNVDPPPGG